MIVLRLVVFILVTISVGCTQQNTTINEEFKVSVETDKKPWSHLKFRNNPDNFQFAIVTDRTGSVRPGVFPKALKRLNLLEPEFVITVGDLISANRKTTDEKIAHKMWDEVENFIDYLDMPFFYLAGNHDNGSPLLSKVWKERFGVEYYHFIYKDVLFLCMNAQDSESFSAVIEKEQQEWAKKVLAENADVRWTFVFVHQPVWMYEKGLPLAEGGSLEPRDTGWKVIEKALEGRKHTAFAGHVHQYVQYKTGNPNNNYYSLATTGGGSRMRGVDFGEFDHATWVTMTENGPKIANLLIDGILPEDINNEEQELFRGLVKAEATVKSLDPYVIQFDLKIANKLGKDLSGHMEWDIANNTGRKVDLEHEHLDFIAGGGDYQKTLNLRYEGDPQKIFPLAKLNITTKDKDGRVFAAQVKLSGDELEAYFEKHKLKLKQELKEERIKMPITKPKKKKKK
jgi:hypothetical protein